MTGNTRQRSSGLQIFRGDAFAVGELRAPQRQRPCFVKDNGVRFGEPFQGVAGFYEHAAFEKPPRGDHLHRRRGEPERAGASDDQDGDGVHNGDARTAADKHPAQERRQRQRMHDWHVEPRGAIGEPNISATRLFAGLNQTRQISNKRSFNRRRRTHDQAIRHIKDAGVNCIVDTQFLRRAFAGHHRAVRIGRPLDNHAVNAGAIAGRQEQPVANCNIPRRNGVDGAIFANALRGRFLHGQQIARGGAGAPSQAMVEVTADQQKKEQHHRSVKIGVLTARKKFIDADGKRQNHRQ